MPQLTARAAAVSAKRSQPVSPSQVRPENGQPFLQEQQLEAFGDWVGEAIWAPPLDSEIALAESMLRESRPFSSEKRRWEAVVERHRSEFTQVREIELRKASIRLPQGKFFVSVTERQNFGKIEEEIPACVQTRLDEFMAGPGKKWGVKVYYLKPLCVEVGDDLILTKREDLLRKVSEIKQAVFSEYRRRAIYRRPLNAVLGAVDIASALPRRAVKYLVARRQKAIDAYHARLEFKRRKLALGAARTYQKCRTDGCTFDEMLSLTTPLDPADVAHQYGVEKKLSHAKRDQLVRMAAGSTPWFVTLSLGVSHLVSVISTFSLTIAPPVVMCDPVFVAELPEAPGVLWKIGHFDEVGGVMHIEI